MTNDEEDKLMTVLEFYLSLHEADEIYNAIFDKSMSWANILELLKKYHEEIE